MKIKLEKPLILLTQVQAKEEVYEITLLRIVDSPEKRCVNCFVKEVPTRTFCLWSGDMYDKIGQWTDDVVEKRLCEIL